MVFSYFLMVFWILGVVLVGFSDFLLVFGVYKCSCLFLRVFLCFFPVLVAILELFHLVSFVFQGSCCLMLSCVQMCFLVLQRGSRVSFGASPSTGSCANGPSPCLQKKEKKFWSTRIEKKSVSLGLRVMNLAF